MGTWTDEQVPANGISVHYLRTGGARPPVVLLHGLTDNGACWTRLARDLEADYDLTRAATGAPPSPLRATAPSIVPPIPSG